MTIREKSILIIAEIQLKKSYLKLSINAVERNATIKYEMILKKQFDNFWEIADYDLQNYILNGLTNVEISNNNIKHWEYFVSDSGIKYKVCKIVFCKSFAN